MPTAEFPGGKAPPLPCSPFEQGEVEFFHEGEGGSRLPESRRHLSSSSLVHELFGA